MDPGKHVILKKTKLPLRANKHIGSRFDKVRSESEHTSDQHLFFLLNSYVETIISDL